MVSNNVLAENGLLKRHQMPASFGIDAVRPSYDGLGLVNVPALVLRLLGVEGEPGTAPVFNPTLYGSAEVEQNFQRLVGNSPINHVVVLLMDALGYDQLENQFNKGLAPNLERVSRDSRNFYAPITSVYPSTTVTALASVATARTPQEHGVLGTVTFFPNFGSTVNLIGVSAGFDGNTPIPESLLNPDELLPVPNIFTTLERRKISTFHVNYYAYEHSGISRYCTSGSKGKYIGYTSPAGGFNALRNLLEELPADGSLKSYSYVYIPNVDTTAHAYGPLTSFYEAELASLDYSLGRELFGAVKRDDILLVIIADHGQLQATLERTVWVNEHPELMNLMMAPLGGEARAPYLYLRNRADAQEKAGSFIRENFGEFTTVLSRAEAHAAGVFGNPEQEPNQQWVDRSGDLLLFPREGWQYMQMLRGHDRRLRLIGVHGGLSRAEMLVPFLALRLNQS
jgi:hypothetical protein